MGTAEMIFLYVLLLVVILLMAVILIRQGRQGGTLPPGRDSHDELVRIAQRVESGNRANQEASAQLRAEVSDALRRGLKTQSEQLLNASKLQTDSLVNLQDRVIRTLQTETDRLQQ